VSFRSAQPLITCSSSRSASLTPFKRLAGYHVFAGVRKEADAKSIADTGITTLHPLMLDVTKHESVVEAISQVSPYVYLCER
jgi:NADP-dependent 3-hydroxy acid dehydrogenase YdfG